MELNKRILLTQLTRKSLRFIRLYGDKIPNRDIKKAITYINKVEKNLIKQHRHKE